MPTPGPLELAIVLIIVLVIFGPKRLPGLGRQLGSGMREFKDSITGKSGSDDDDDEAEAGRPEITAAAPATPPEESPAKVAAEDSQRS
jgi:sec-independent protein translocase protein TatA